MKTILVPTDFSDHALFALKAAASIAHKIKAEIKLIHVCNLLSAGFAQYNQYYYQYNKENLKLANEQLIKLTEHECLEGIVVNKYIVTDMLIWETVSDERFKNVDLIVIGSHGTSGFNSTFIGSNTEKIVRLADAPVLTIKTEIEDFRINKIVFASNFMDESYKSFEKIKFFADLYDAHIDLLKIITPKDFESTLKSQKLIDNFAKKFDLTDYSKNIYNADKIEKGIIDFCYEQNSDLIAIETHGRTGFAHLINGSLTEDLVKHVTKPVLSIKMEKPQEFISKLLNYNKSYENWKNES
ncbi:universal stress protein [Labilibaculum antarcticum]|uniref:Universal stress protein UspA n=1 Tax=Labilibaculum antarcticum TaxID=1717717 RepID=A0A1Y1CDL3_9BACT|nr:universal stress protein [Labilibaculum antarcticum]BAX78427.1 universal stress protein UspA [Labilibaculum antarcticum]